MARLVAAVGKVIQKKGYPGLTMTNISIAAGVDKKLITTYFGGVNNLIEKYVIEKDFWKLEGKKNIEKLLCPPLMIGKDEINTILQKQFEIVYKDKALQKIIHWELGEYTKLLRNLVDQREELGEQVFSIIMPQFEKANVDLRARLALLISGIYYLSIHANTNGSKFCGIDINEQEGFNRISNAIKDIIFETYNRAEI